MLILLIASMIIGFTMVFFIWKQDIYNSEPFWRLVVATLFGGVVSMSMALFLYHGLENLGVFEAIGTAEYFYIVAPTEEISKFLAFILFVRVFKVELDEPVDAAIYLACTALGFSLIENFGYSISDSSLVGIRALISTPTHIVFSSAIALVYVTQKHDRHFYSNLAKALGVAILAHGCFDTAVSDPAITDKLGLMHLLLIFWVMAIWWSRKVFSYGLLNSPHRKDLVTELGAPAQEKKDFPCLPCNRATAHSVFLFRGSTLNECGECKNVILSDRKAQRLISYFLPHYGAFQYDSSLIHPKVTALTALTYDNSYRKFHNFKIAQLNVQFEELAKLFGSNFENTLGYRLVFGTGMVVSPEEKIILKREDDQRQLVVKQLAMFFVIWISMCIVIVAIMMIAIHFMK